MSQGAPLEDDQDEQLAPIVEAALERIEDVLHDRSRPFSDRVRLVARIAATIERTVPGDDDGRGSEARRDGVGA